MINIGLWPKSLLTGSAHCVLMGLCRTKILYCQRATMFAKNSKHEAGHNQTSLKSSKDHYLQLMKSFKEKKP